MKMLPKYTKVLNLGAPYTERALIGEVILQEKIDGSQFRFGLNEDHELIMGSKGVNWEKGCHDKMFNAGVEHLWLMEQVLKDNFSSNTFFFAEFLKSEKHNVLKYGRVPKNHFVLFDVIYSDGSWANRTELENDANLLDIDIVPELWRGKIEMQRVGAGPKFDRTKGYTGLDFLKNIVNQNMSFLGEEVIEGVVIKNYVESIMLGGSPFPLFTKYVREAYRERHQKDPSNRPRKQSIDDFVKGFNSENRWQKAFQHLRDGGKLVHDLKDIGALIQEVHSDIKEEDSEFIKNELLKFFIKDILRTSTRGLPEWYKEKLIENTLEKQDAID